MKEHIMVSDRIGAGRVCSKSSECGSGICQNVWDKGDRFCRLSTGNPCPIFPSWSCKQGTHCVDGYCKEYVQFDAGERCSQDYECKSKRCRKFDSRCARLGKAK